jgi:hypothetical protein
VAGTNRSNEQDKQKPQRTRHEPLVAEPQENQAVFAVNLPKKSRQGFEDCSRFCSCQSTKKPQGSTEVGMSALNSSIKSSYFHTISTAFYKRSDLFWEQMEHQK